MEFEIVLQKVAERFGSAPEDVLRNIQETVDAGFDSADPRVRAAWRRIPFRGERSTAEEALLGVAARLKKRARHLGRLGRQN